MRRYLFITLLILTFALTAGAMVFMFGRQDEHWTTRSEEALEEFRLGLQDEHRFYRTDALEHYARALELDPGFVMARLKVSQLGGPMSREKWLELLDEVPLEDLSERERTLISIRRTSVEKDREATLAIMDGYLAKHPSDPYILTSRCDYAWGKQQWEIARQCYERIINTNPNWVSAVNNLGYIAMAQGRMDDAYEHFATYRYIAPDQANPHDSMGELLTLTGRYDEAEKQFLRAVELRPDYCASWQHLLLLAAVRGDHEAYASYLARAQRESGCEADPQVHACESAVIEASRGTADLLDVLQTKECQARTTGALFVLAYEIASRTGDAEAHQQLKNILAGNDDGAPQLRTHLDGLAQLRERRATEAAGTFEEIDKALVWFGDGQGLFKAYNRALLVAALERSGQKERAAKIAEETRKINATLFESAVAHARRL